MDARLRGGGGRGRRPAASGAGGAEGAPAGCERERGPARQVHRWHWNGGPRGIRQGRGPVGTRGPPGGNVARGGRKIAARSDLASKRWRGPAMGRVACRDGISKGGPGLWGLPAASCRSWLGCEGGKGAQGVSAGVTCFWEAGGAGRGATVGGRGAQFRDRLVSSANRLDCLGKQSRGAGGRAAPGDNR